MTETPGGRRTIAFTKAHGAGNDFVVVDDHGGADEAIFKPETVADLCRRRLGIGADGLLRVVRTAAAPADAAGVVRAATAAAAAGGSPVPEWFMDYRNADGSLAQMCGNGVRVFAAHLRSHGLVPAEGPVPLLTRSGVRTVRTARAGLPSEWTTVAMGPVELGPVELGSVELGSVELDAEGGSGGLTVTVGTATWRARSADVGNPHAVVVLSAADFAALGPVGTLPTPTAEPASTFGEGFNLEFVTVRDPGAVAVRILERGVGETLACGTGVCAAVAVAASAGLDPAALAAGIAVTVPGGALDVRLTGSGPHFTGSELSGPAEVVATGTAVLSQRGEAVGAAEVVATEHAGQG